MLEIFKLNAVENVAEYEDILFQIKYIFYISSSIKEFSSPERKIAFFKRWCGDYISNYPEQFLVMREDEKVLGYMSTCENSLLAMGVLEVPAYDLFSDLFSTFPVHLHINFHPDCRGRGLGSKLVEYCCNNLRDKGLQGIHLVTSPEAENVSFYQRLGFNHEVRRESPSKSLLLGMGKLLR